MLDRFLLFLNIQLVSLILGRTGLVHVFVGSVNPLYGCSLFSCSEIQLVDKKGETRSAGYPDAWITKHAGTWLMLLTA